MDVNKNIDGGAVNLNCLRVGKVKYSSVLTFAKSRVFTVTVPLGKEGD